MPNLLLEDTNFTDALRRSFVSLEKTKSMPGHECKPLTPLATSVLGKIPHMSVEEALKEAHSWW